MLDVLEDHKGIQVERLCDLNKSKLFTRTLLLR